MFFLLEEDDVIEEAESNDNHTANETNDQKGMSDNNRDDTEDCR